MKKLLFILVIIAIGTSVKAQDFFSLGPKIGYNSNTLTNNRDSINTSIDNSLQIGAFIRVGKKFYFQPEANYQVVKGTINNSMIPALRQEYNLKTIKVPALIGVKLVNRAVVNLRVMAGPAFTFVIDKKLEPSIVNELWPIKSTDDIKNSTWSMQVGAGLDVLFMTLDVRYEIGVGNMYNGNSSFELKNNVFNVSLGVKLL